MAKVLFNGATFVRRDDESVLDALTRGGADVPHSCRRGTCHACMMRVTEGDVPPESTEALSEDLVASGHFLPCQDRSSTQVEVELTQVTENFIPARLLQREQLFGDVWRLRLLPQIPMPWVIGQYVHLRHENGDARPYAITNHGERSRFLEIYVQRIEGGLVSTWLCDSVAIGDHIDIQGPFGEFTWSTDDAKRALFFFITHSAVGLASAMIRDAYARGHRAETQLLVSAPSEAIAGIQQALQPLVDDHPQLRLDVVDDAGEPHKAIAQYPNLPEAPLCFIAGHPEVVQYARAEAVLMGIPRVDVRTLYFEPSHDFWPSSQHPADLMPPATDLWERLEHGALMKRILDDFYDEVYQDTILSPYFQKVTKDWAASKQYAFLADAFANTRDYLGSRPFNAHHWMIIPDWVFDYREDLFEKYLNKYNVAQDIQRRWLWFHELFRREIVKSKARGLIIGGQERRIQGFTDERLEVGTVCDGCGGEINVGEYGRLHHLSGQLFCQSCKYALPENPPASAHPGATV